MDFQNYRELIEMVQAAQGVSVVVRFYPDVTDEDSNESYPSMTVTNITDPALLRQIDETESDCG